MRSPPVRGTRIGRVRWSCGEAAWGRPRRLRRVLFVVARPRKEEDLRAVRREAVEAGDVTLLPQVWEHYHNITHQTLEACRAAALDRGATHLLKVRPPPPPPLLNFPLHHTQ